MLSTVCRPTEKTRGCHFGKFFFFSFNGPNDDFCLLLPVGEGFEKLPTGVAGRLLPSAGDITGFSQETSGDFNFLMCVGGGKNVDNKMLSRLLERNSLDDTPSVCL